jgi:hypothetical protein
MAKNVNLSFKLCSRDHQADESDGDDGDKGVSFGVVGLHVKHIKLFHLNGI